VLRREKDIWLVSAHNVYWKKNNFQ